MLFFLMTLSKITYLCKTNCSEEEIVRACKFAASDDFIKKLPQGYDTMIGENGIRLAKKQEYQLPELFESLLFY